MKTIVLVDDNEDLREIYGAVLRRAGFDVREAENGEEALTMLHAMAADPCVMLLDLMMPVMNGAELLRVLQEDPRFASLPVVVLSAGGRASDAPEAKRFIRKPVEPDVLVALAHEFCDARTGA